MKKFKIIELKTFDGEPIKDIQTKKKLTSRDIILNHLGLFQGRGDENIKAYDIGIKIAQLKTQDIILEDAEYELVVKALEKQPPVMSALAIGQTLKSMEENDKK